LETTGKKTGLKKRKNFHLFNGTGGPEGRVFGANDLGPLWGEMKMKTWRQGRVIWGESEQKSRLPQTRTAQTKKARVTLRKTAQGFTG